MRVVTIFFWYKISTEKCNFQNVIMYYTKIKIHFLKIDLGEDDLAQSNESIKNWTIMCILFSDPISNIQNEMSRCCLYCLLDMCKNGITWLLNHNLLWVYFDPTMFKKCGDTFLYYVIFILFYMVCIDDVDHLNSIFSTRPKWVRQNWQHHDETAIVISFMIKNFVLWPLY